jgi:tetratricopeptide (TPR) repeat protein
MGKIMPFSDSHVVVKPMDSLLHSYTATTAASETGAFLALAEQGRQAQRTGNVQTAFQYYRKAIQYKKQSIESESLEIKQVYAGILFELGWMYDTSLQEPETSSELLHQCLDLRIEIYGHDHIDVAIVLYKLAEIHERLNELEYSYNLILEALAIMLDKADAIVLSAMWTALGRIQKALGQTEDAQSSLMAAQAGSSSKSSSSTASNNPDNTPVTTTTTTTTTSSPTTMLRTT